MECEYLEEYQPKTKRIRENPTKKWTLAEEKMLIEYLLEPKDLEKPTAQSYYKAFTANSKLGVDWKLTRAKVRNMRIKYNKAKSWEGSTGAGSMDGETVKAVLEKKCYFFSELDEVFGTRIVSNAIIEESCSVPSLDVSDCTEIEADDSFLGSECEPSTSRKGIYSRTGLADILNLQTQSLKLKQERADREFSLREKEFQLKEREVAIKEMELKSNEKLKIMELEIKERLQMEELKLKYK